MKKDKFMFVLGKLEEELAVPHREGHCEHGGYCELIPVLREFLESKAGEKSLDGFSDWYDGESADELFIALATNRMKSVDWIDSEEISAWMEKVQVADIKHAVDDEICFFCRYYGDEVPGHCSVGSEKPEPCEPADTCSQFTAC